MNPSRLLFFHEPNWLVVVLKHVVLFSGGVSSSYVAWMVLQEQKKEDVILLHTPTYTENHDADTFRHEVARYLGMPITEWGLGLNVWELMDQEHTLPSFFIPYCTRKLKQEMKEQFYEYLNEIGEDFIEYVGFGAEESNRVMRATARNELMGRKVRFPIYEKQVPSDEIKRIITEEWKIKLPKAYETLSHNNCIPCFKAGKGAWRMYWKHYPEQFKRAAEYEEKFEYTVFKDVKLKDLAIKWENDEKEDALQVSFADLPCECWI
jgi:3'-phosphoadenosine 5'-phosphosulfate sulfotransferase (PAPS reductase)/FAD synthetase